MMRIMASLTKAATVRAYRSKSRAKRRLRLIHARVRSTIQRFGKTTNLCSSLRLTISNTQRPVLASRSGGARSLIAGIGEDALDEGEEAAGAPIANQPRPVAVLNIGGMNDDVQQEAERIEGYGAYAR